MVANAELERHRQNWHDFVRLMTYVVGSVAAILILMAIFLV
jgi:hypothetical protein